MTGKKTVIPVKSEIPEIDTVDVVVNQVPEKKNKITFFTEKMLSDILINNRGDAHLWYPLLRDMLEEYDINTPVRVAAFLAQTTHESNDFKTREENLRYSAERLLVVFPRYFKDYEQAKYHSMNGERLANYVYMDVNRTARGALGNVEPGDGWLFRGRGLKQLTGRSNYERFGTYLKMDVNETVEYLSTMKGALHSACWFWKINDCNTLADSNDIDAVSKRVNGGSIGLKDRRDRYKRILKVMESQ